MLFLDITKGSPNFTFTLFGQNDNLTIADVTVATYLAQLPLSSPSIPNHGMSSGITQAIAEGTYGYFDAVNIGWDRTSPAIELSDLAVVKFA